jgi:cystathionine beta-lyase
VISWYKRRYKWEIKREWIVFTPGVVPAINFAIKAFTNAGDKVIVQTPVYYPFFSSIESNGRYVLNNPLILKNGRYEMDLADLRQKVKDPRSRLIILCSPHNPVGRVWSREELSELGDICIDNGVLVVSDEIHSDLVYPGVVHTNFASISEKFADNSITCTSASKTFNLAGLQISNIIIPNQWIRQIYENSVFSVGISQPNAFAEVAVKAAYDECEDWLEEFLKYLKGNLDFLKEFIKEKIPKVKVIEPEGTYLCWLDFREVEPDPKKLEQIMLRVAKVAFDEGYIFRDGGAGFERVNMACPRPILKEALNRIADALSNLDTANEDS